MVSFLSFSGPRMICPCYRRMTAAHENICVFCESVFLLCVYSKACEVTQSSGVTQQRSAVPVSSPPACAVRSTSAFGFYTTTQNNRPPIGWENRSRWITPSQLDSDTSWPVKRCFLLIEGAGERERLQPPAAFPGPRCCWTNTLVLLQSGGHESTVIDVLCSRNIWRPFFVCAIC